MLLWVIPHIAWGVHGTVVSFRDIAVAASRPLISGVVAGAVTLGAQFLWLQSLSAPSKLMLGASILLTIYVTMLFYVMGQKSLYMKLLRDILGRRSVVENRSVPAFENVP
jgi:hypothetical protein